MLARNAEYEFRSARSRIVISRLPEWLKLGSDKPKLSRQQQDENGSLDRPPSDKDKLLNLAFAAQAELVFQLDDATWEVAL